jgi:hypothetical protein
MMHFSKAENIITTYFSLLKACLFEAFSAQPVDHFRVTNSSALVG